jgi:hypothetical protein
LASNDWAWGSRRIALGFGVGGGLSAEVCGVRLVVLAV